MHWIKPISLPPLDAGYVKIDSVGFLPAPRAEDSGGVWQQRGVALLLGGAPVVDREDGRTNLRLGEIPRRMPEAQVPAKQRVHPAQQNQGPAEPVLEMVTP